MKSEIERFWLIAGEETGIIEENRWSKGECFMDFFEAVSKRYSHRTAFLNQPIPDEDIRKMIDAGIRAPSGMNAQTTSFVVVTDPALRTEIAEVVPTPAVQTAPVILAVLTEHVVTPCGLAFEIEDYAASTQNILLAAAALGYGTVWMDGKLKSESVNARIREILNVPEGKHVRCILPVGVPAETGRQNERKSFEERCTYNRF